MSRVGAAGLRLEREPAAESLDPVAQPAGIVRGRVAHDDVHHDVSVLLPHGHARGRAGPWVLEQLPAAQQDRSRDPGGTEGGRRDVDRDREAEARHRLADRDGEPGLEERRVDALRELRRLADRLLDVSSHVLDRGLRSLRVGVHLHARELEVDGERHEMLLHAPVQLALDRAAVGVGREDEPLARRA